MKKIPYGKQFIDSQDILSVQNSLKEELITTGKYVEKFEKEFVKFTKSKFAISCNSGTSALHLALSSINLKKNDIIIMPVINFIAVYNMSNLLGAKIYLADVDSLTGQMTPSTLSGCVKKNKIKKIKLIITMYLGGYPENILQFYKIKKKYNCLIIEDACHALGATYEYKKKQIHIGSCQHADISCFSLHPVKTITAGEGGVLTTNNKSFYERIKLLRSHGIIRNKKKHWEYDVINLGYNYRLSDINSALALSQLKKIKRFVSYRKKISLEYTKNLVNFIDLPKYNLKNSPAFHLFLISIRFDLLKISKDIFFKFLRSKNIFFQFHYIPIYKFKIFKDKKNNFKGAEYYYQNSLSIPIYYKLKNKDQKKVVLLIKDFIKKNKFKS